ncbi:hypothetical protein Bca101_074805 [Brassica carinata]
MAPGVGANLLGQHSAERNQEATVYVGGLEPQLSEELLWELFVQAGPLVNVYVPKDRAIKVLNMIKIHGKPIRVNKASQDKKSLDFGANLFIGNLDPVSIYDGCGIASNPKIMRDPDTGNSRGFGFISYDSFDASDAAIESMTGQYLCNRQITVSYAYKKDTKGERHGTPAERLLAATNPIAQKSRPHTLFASGPPTAPQANGIPRPFANGGMQPVPIPGPRPTPPPPPPQVYQTQPQSWQSQPRQQQHGLAVPPPMQMQYRPPQGMPPPPPPQFLHHQQGFGGPRPQPPPQAMGMHQHGWPPQHMQQGGPPPPQQPMHYHHPLSIPPPPPHQG